MGVLGGLLPRRSPWWSSPLGKGASRKEAWAECVTWLRGPPEPGSKSCISPILRMQLRAMFWTSRTSIKPDRSFELVPQLGPSLIKFEVSTGGFCFRPGADPETCDSLRLRHWDHP